MSVRRSQGRPCRGETEVGKEKILLAFRDLLRSEKCHDLSRKTVAARAGVTPALISYYFPKKENLMLEAVTPVVTAYADEICKLVNDPCTIDEKAKGIVKILIRLHKNDGKFIDVYRDLARTDRATDQIARITGALSWIFDPNKRGRATNNLDALVLQGAIWGMCRFAALAEQSTAIEDEEAPQEWLPIRLAATLLSIVGLAPSVATSSFSPAVG